MPFEMDSTISIHAPREGGRRRAPEKLRTGGSNFNPRPPRGGRLLQINERRYINIFQSTPPARGGDAKNTAAYAVQYRISIHAPRKGGDYCTFACSMMLHDFNPRPPQGGRRHLTSK